MKTFPTFPTLLLLSLAGLAASLPAQEKPVKPDAPPVRPSVTVTEERTTTAVLPDPNLDKIEGKIQRMEPLKNQLMLRTKHGKEPIPYNVIPATKIIDLDGKPVNPALLIAEVPVEIRYVENASELIASTVIVQRYQAPLPGGGVTLTNRETLKAGGKIIEETVKTTTTTRSGKLRAFEPGFLTLAPEGEAIPLRYQYSETTAWVNAKGEPVPVAVVKPGYSVTVSYTQRGDTLFADQVMLMMPSSAPDPESPPAK
jgi:hypothetical protein